MFGLDLYSLGTTRSAVLKYLDRIDSNFAETARLRYACLDPWVEDHSTYDPFDIRSCIQDINRIQIMRNRYHHGSF